MPRPPRVELENGIFHVTAHSVFEHRVFVVVTDRFDFLFLLMRVVRRHGWIVLAYCLMGTHYHLVVQTPQPTLSRGVQLLNGWYAQRFNRRHTRRGHLFEGRFAAQRLETESHLLSTLRYVDQNPVRAGLCGEPAEWRWGSFRALAGLVAAPEFLAVEHTLAFFADEPLSARRIYRDFVEAKPARVELELDRHAAGLGGAK